jgi:hypothetical protein
VVAPGLVDDLGVEGLDVVGAQQPQRGHVAERQVHQRLVALALDQLGAGAVGADRLADAAQQPVGRAVLEHEALPHRQEPGGVAAQPGDVGEEQLLVLVAQLGAQHVDLLGAEHHEDRDPGAEPALDERERAGHELLEPGVQEGLVSERRGGRRRRRAGRVSAHLVRRS